MEWANSLLLDFAGLQAAGLIPFAMTMLLSRHHRTLEFLVCWIASISFMAASWCILLLAPALHAQGLVILKIAAIVLLEAVGMVPVWHSTWEEFLSW